MNANKIPNFRLNDLGRTEPRNWTDVTYQCMQRELGKEAKRRTKDTRRQIRSAFKDLFRAEWNVVEEPLRACLATAAIGDPDLFIECFKHFAKKRSNYDDLTYMIQNWKEHPKYETIFGQEVLTAFDNYFAFFLQKPNMFDYEKRNKTYPNRNLPIL